MNDFNAVRPRIADQFKDIAWIAESGLSHDELKKEIHALCKGEPHRDLLKAKILAFLASHAPIAIDRDDAFQDKLYGADIVGNLRRQWEKDVKERYFSPLFREMQDAYHVYGAYRADADYGHTSPNTRLMLSVGITGLLRRVEEAAARDGLTEKQKRFYASAAIALSALITLARRLADAVKPYNPTNAAALYAIAEREPQTCYEAMQLIMLYFFFHEYVGGTRVRTLGRLDILLYPFYRHDIAEGSYTHGEIRELLRFFLHKFWAAKVPFDLPFCIGSTDRDGSEATNAFSYLIVETYNELDIHSPKIHVRVSEATPRDFVTLVLSCIRGGNSSFVFINDEIGIKSMQKVGATKEDARDFVPIGCYEPAIWGKELGCTGNASLNLAKAVELVFTGGYDLKSGVKIGDGAPPPESFDEFLSAVKANLRYTVDRIISFVSAIEGHYAEINPDPLLSCQYEESVLRGLDVYEGGATYNNSSINLAGIASLTDSVCAVKRLVFEEKRVTFSALTEILKQNWQGFEALRETARRLPEKYGNANPVADALAQELAHYAATLINGRKNGRGGVFKAALYSIDRCFFYGARTMATPDGRHEGEELSKNLCATVSMDKNGVTSLVRSATEIDFTEFPNGSVLDVVLHPSVVRGDDGLMAFYAILITYFKRGGFALHGNVFDAEELRRAQREPEKYKTLQVRLCGWNAYFVNLTAEQQNSFIVQAENRMGG